mmetsp:Transcript_25997/g.85541  ORF Transcript_25997/g.85541 Transcript_25997/m.85541 type:complete len:227 (+) Transcript_25997:1049-1729(+)
MQVQRAGGVRGLLGDVHGLLPPGGLYKHRPTEIPPKALPPARCRRLRPPHRCWPHRDGHQVLGRRSFLRRALRQEEGDAGGRVDPWQRDQGLSFLLSLLPSRWPGTTFSGRSLRSAGRGAEARLQVPSTSLRPSQQRHEGRSDRVRDVHGSAGSPSVPPRSASLLGSLFRQRSSQTRLRLEGVRDPRDAGVCYLSVDGDFRLSFHQELSGGVRSHGWILHRWTFEL